MFVNQKDVKKINIFAGILMLFGFVFALLSVIFPINLLVCGMTVGMGIGMALVVEYFDVLPFEYRKRGKLS